MREGAAESGVSLDAKYRPSTDSAKATFESILQVTGELLSEVGFERLSTNMVAARAGLSPPALYRYFPNKYALLAELGRRLMLAQDEEVMTWHDNLAEAPPSLEQRVASHMAIMKRNVEITREMPGGAWIMRALRAVPLLQEIRIESRNLVADSLYNNIRRWYPQTSEPDLRLATRLSIELGYSAIEMVIQEPDLDADKVLGEAARMVEIYYDTMA